MKSILKNNSAVLKSFMKVAKDKNLIKEEAPKLLDLKASDDLMSNVLKLCNGLRAKGFEEYANELESNFLLYTSASISYESDGSKKLIDEAHPDGSFEMKDVDGEAIFHTVLDTQVKMLETLSKTPKIKNAHIISEVKKVFGQLREDIPDTTLQTLLNGGAGQLIKDVVNTRSLTPEEQEILKRRQGVNKVKENKALSDKLAADYDVATKRVARFKAIIKANNMKNANELNTFLDKVNLFLSTNKQNFISNDFKEDEKVREPYVKKLNEANAKLDTFENRWLK